MCHRHHLKRASVVLNAFTVLGLRQRHLSLEHDSSFHTEIPYLLRNASHSPPTPHLLMNSLLLLFLKTWTIRGTRYKQNHLPCVLLQLAPFTQRSAFKLYAHCIHCQTFPPLQAWLISHCLYTHRVFQLTPQQICRLLPPADYWEHATLNEYTNLSPWLQPFKDILRREIIGSRDDFIFKNSC